MRVALAAGLALVLGGCAGLGAANPISPARARIQLSSPAFAAGGPIPAVFTCQGRDASPPLRISGVPRAAHQLELVMRDLDASGGKFIHWQLTGITPATRQIAEAHNPPGSRAGRNGFGSVGYRGPCPPAGPPHHYRITVTATTGAAVLGVGTLSGTYARR